MSMNTPACFTTLHPKADASQVLPPGYKRAFATRNVDLSLTTELRTDLAPAAGDLVLARVSRVGQHKRIERPDGRRSHLYAGDHVVVCFGARYAPDQFEAVVPDDLSACSLVAAGGIAGKVLSRHRSVATATALQPVGLLVDASGAALNVSASALPALSASLPPVITVLGSSMNAGKTTAAARMIRGLSREGLVVGAAKITGTGAGGDFWSMLDAGAHRVLDFTDAGLATTSNVSVEQLLDVLNTLTSQLAADGVDVIVLEVADGLLQKETAALLQHPAFKAAVDGVLFAAADALGAVHGEAYLQANHHNLLGLSGSFTASPLAVREVQASCDTPVFSKTDLSDPTIVSDLVARAVGFQHEAACAP